MKKTIFFSLLLIAVLTFNLSATQYYGVYHGRNYLQETAEVMKVFNGQDAPLTAGQGVIRKINTSYLAVELGDSVSQYMFFGVVKTAADTDMPTDIIIGGDATIAVNASQTDTTTAGGLPIVLGANGKFDVLDSSAFSDTDSTDLVIAKVKRIVGYTLEAVDSDFATTISAYIYKK
jgi:hypothetical protein